MQTQFPFALPEAQPAISAYVDGLSRLDEAQRPVRMSRTEFYRLRRDCGVHPVPSRRVHGADIIRTFERHRGLPGNGPYPTLHEYSCKLLKLQEVCTTFGMKVTSLYKLRIRHKVPRLPGGSFLCDDIIAAIEAERQGERRPASRGPIRVMTRSRRPLKLAK